MNHVPSSIRSTGAAVFATGTQPDTAILAMTGMGMIASAKPYVDGQVQPASLDLRLGAKAWRVRASFLPGRSATVMDRIEQLGMFEIDLTDGAVLETGCIYVAEIQEKVSLPVELRGTVNPKSSTGRLDVFTRMIADRAVAYDTVVPGYAGPLYAEISPGTFPVVVREGSRLSQIRFRSGRCRLDDAETAALHALDPLTDAPSPCFENGVAFSIDLKGFGPDRVVGYKAIPFAGAVDMDKAASQPWQKFWERIHVPTDDLLILHPSTFYIFASKESVAVPSDHAAEMVAFDPMLGELRCHLAGFFDPGFGASNGDGPKARGVLEVRCRDVPFAVADGQVLGRLVYERMASRPDRLYGSDLKSNYQGQSLKLAKHFY